MKQISIFIFLFSSITIFGQNSESKNFTGILSFDSKLVSEITAQEFEPDGETISVNKKSPLLAGVLSFALPGAGEFYSEDYLKSAVFLAIEAAAITAAVIYDNKGDDQTGVFENYANSYWDVQKYADWTVDNAMRINPNLDPAYLDIYDQNGDVIWSKLNDLESEIGHYYSHQLENFGKQQYYEMIGKYPQFNPGWQDFSDPYNEWTYTDDRQDPVTEKFLHYAGLRDQANDFYNVAAKAVIIVVVNHVISAFDAAWTANRYNKNINLNMSLAKANVGFYTEYYPKVNLEYRF